jgi:hypothetical protein
MSKHVTLSPKKPRIASLSAGQSTIFTLTSDRATGEAYCLAHHVTVDGGKRRLMLASLRYLDTFLTHIFRHWLGGKWPGALPEGAQALLSG